MKIALALAAGLLFGAGLTLSAMIDPAKIMGFLDLAGDWDPSLLLVMAAAVATTAAGLAIARRRPAPFAAAAYSPPAKTRIDRGLVAGALLFGVGWGLTGYCPGPALAAAPLAGTQTWVFLAAMLAGMAAIRRMRG